VVLIARFKVEGVTRGRLTWRGGADGVCRRLCIGVLDVTSDLEGGYLFSLGVRDGEPVEGGLENAGVGARRETGVKMSIAGSRPGCPLASDEAVGVEGVVCSMIAFTGRPLA
jgi:hypothetical protein